VSERTEPGEVPELMALGAELGDGGVSYFVAVLLHDELPVHLPAVGVVDRATSRSRCSV